MSPLWGFSGACGLWLQAVHRWLVADGESLVQTAWQVFANIGLYW